MSPIPMAHAAGLVEKADPSCEIASSQAALDAVAPEWDPLCKESDEPNVFMTHGWYRAWTKRHASENGARYAPHVVVLREGARVVGIAPLVKRIASRWLRVRKLEFATAHSDYNDLLVAKDPANQFRAFAEFLCRTADEWDLMDLHGLRNSKESLAQIEGALASVGLSYLRTTEMEGCPFLPIEGDATQAMKRLSGHERRVLRKRLERAAAEGLKVRIVERPDQDQDLVAKLVGIELHKSLRCEYPPFIEVYPEVFQTLFQSLGSTGWMYVALMEHLDRVVAYQVGFLCGRKLWDYSKAYDRNYTRYAPGTSLLPALLDFGHQRGFCEYDFLRGEEPHKLVWSTGIHQRYRLMIWNRRKASRIRKFIYHDVKVFLRRLLHQGA